MLLAFMVSLEMARWHGRAVRPATLNRMGLDGPPCTERTGTLPIPVHIACSSADGFPFRSLQLTAFLAADVRPPPRMSLM